MDAFESEADFASVKSFFMKGSQTILGVNSFLKLIAILETVSPARISISVIASSFGLMILISMSS